MGKNSVVTNFIWRFMERIGAQLVTFVVSIIIARILSPEDYSAISIILVFITFANILVSNGFATALIQKKNADDLDFSSVFYFSLILSVIIYIVIFMLAPTISNMYDMPILTPTLRILGIRVIISSLNSVQHSYVARKMIFKKFFYSTIGGTIVSAIVGIALAYYGFGVWALVFQYLTNTVIDTIVLWFVISWRPIKAFSFVRLKQLLSYGWKLLASALIGAIYDDLRTLIIGKVCTKEELAYYSKGQQFPKLIMSNISTSITSVIFPHFSNLQDEPEKLKLSVRKTLRVSTTIIAPLMFGLLAVANPVVKLLLTDKWLLCVPFLQLCCIFYLVSSVYSIYLQSYKSIGKSGLSLKIELVDDIIGILLVLCFYKMGAITITFIMVMSRIFACFICLYYNKKLLKIQYKEQIYDIFVPIVFSVLMTILILCINFIKINYIIRMVIQVLTGVVFYIGICRVFHYPFIEIIVDYLRKITKKS